MKIVIAPDAYKENLSALEVARALERGIRRVIPDAECIKLPMADGGEGTVDAVISARGGRRVRKSVMGPLGHPVRASYGLLDDGHTAVIEIAAASGLPLVPLNQRNPLKTTSYGSGELIRAALARNVQRIIVGLGGSATNDAGVGMAQALGVRFYGSNGAELAAGVAGGGLGRIESIDMRSRNAALATTELIVATDVENKLIGKTGAAAVFGPQKGASAAQVRKLEQNLAHLGRIIERDLSLKVLSLPGGGAAGGLGAGMVAFAGGTLVSGVRLVGELVGLEGHLASADLVITGEGRIDRQTAFGKAPAGVAAAAADYGIPVVAVGGGLADDARSVFSHGIDALESAVVRDMGLDEALLNARKHVRDAGERVAKWLVLGQRMAACKDQTNARKSAKTS